MSIRMVNYRNASHLAELVSLLHNQNIQLMQPYHYVILKDSKNAVALGQNSKEGKI